MIRLIALALLLSSALQVHAALSGTKSIGPTGDYSSITTALADLQAQGLDGPLILELQTTYVSTVETFPVTFTNLGTTPVNTLTLRPQAGATGLFITSNNTVATVNSNGGSYLTLDGRPGGSGLVKQLTISNTSATGVALSFINEASNNLIQFIKFQSVNASATSGTISFSNTTGANGNSNNTIDNCDIGDGSATPRNGVYSAGTSSSSALYNKGNTISHCNIFNFDAASGVDAAGIRLDAGNSLWSINDNSFYQTSSRTAVSATIRAIYINSSGGVGYTVMNNFIGGSTVHAGGTAWTTTGTGSACSFVGIHLTVLFTPVSSVQGNTIANFVWTSSSTAAVWTGMMIQQGSVNIGTVTGNTIGGGTGTGSISVTTSGVSGMTYGINSASFGILNIANNTIGSITTVGTSNSVPASLTGIQVTAGGNTISGNLVGSTTTAASLDAGFSNSSSAQQVLGIVSTSTNAATITNNTVANLDNAYFGTATTAYVRGIFTQSASSTITGNTVRNLTALCHNPSTDSNASVGGIIQLSGGLPPQTISRNVVHSLANTEPSPSVAVLGIYSSGTVGSVYSGNFVHSFSIVSTLSTSVMTGIQIVGSGSLQNNMVRLGLDRNGLTTAGVCTIRGIWDNSNLARRSVLHNSVYIGGSQTSSPSNTYAFISDKTGGDLTIQNNIFTNNRVLGGTGRNYVAAYAGTAVNPPGLSANSNIFQASSVGNIIGFFNGTGRMAFASWQAATGQDVSSATADAKFVNPTGTAATVDLHLQASNPAEGGGLPVISVTADYDGASRDSLTPVDIGADAGNFSSSTGDIYAPAITLTPLTNATIASRTLSGFAAIVDNSGLVSGGPNAPRLYFKKSSDADVFGGNTSADNGWKFATASNNGPYDFVIDYSIILGGSVSVGDVIQYFVVAQDAANNLGSSPAAATASASPPVQHLNAKPAAGVYSYAIAAPFPGAVTVGPGGTYPTLSGVGGLFSDINNRVLTGNVTATITGSTTETGAVFLNQWPEEGGGGYSLTIRPGDATMKTLTGSSLSTGLISLSGVQRVTIDGSFNGSGRWLTLRNIASSSSTVIFINDASNNTVQNCIIEGAANALGAVQFSSSIATGNSHNIVRGNQIRDRSDASGVPTILIASFGSTLAPNSANTIAGNEIFNFAQSGIQFGAPTHESNAWTITGNTMYQTATRTAVTGINFDADGPSVISDNTFHDFTTTAACTGMLFGQDYGTLTIARNRIYGFAGAAGNTGNFTGITFNGNSAGTLTLVNNQVSIIPSFTNAQKIIGINDQNLASTTTVIAYNSVVVGGTGSSGADTWAFHTSGSDPSTLKNNLFLNVRTGGGNHFAAGGRVSTGPLATDYNVFCGTGLTPANFFDSSLATGSTGTPISYAQWHSNFGGDTHSSAGNPDENFTSAMFVDASNGNLHLIPAGNPLVSGTGTPMAGITTDFDGDLRSATTPNIGTDEPARPEIVIELPAGNVLVDGTSVADFGTATVNGEIVVKFLAVRNIGTADLTGLAVTVDGANAADFGAESLDNTPLAPGTSRFFTVSFGATASGARSAALHVVSNDLDENPFDLALTGTGISPTPFQQWAAAHGVSSDPNASGANGLANLLHFAFGTNPNDSTLGALRYTGTFSGSGAVTAPGQPITRMEDGDIRALFVRRKDFAAIGLTYTVQFSASLTSWQNASSTPTVLADDGINQIVCVAYPTNMTAAGFFRVSISLP